jgi:phosphatidylglycerophosphatase A
VLIVATGLGSGYVPFAPGTAGTVLAVPLFLIFSPLPWPLYLLTVAAFTALAVFTAQEAEKIFHKQDAQCIVIDEIAGFLWTMFLVAPTALHVLLGFVLFRCFDIVKPFPVSWCQRRLPGGWGVVGDDCAAGVYGNILLQALIAWAGV